MKFTKGQKVVCIGNKNEFNPILSDFNRSLQIALGNEKLPEYGKEYYVTNPMELHYDGKCYITIDGFGCTPIDENAFAPLKTIQQYKVEKLVLHN